MSKEIIYAKGLRGFNKHEKSPDFVIGTVVVNIDEFVQFVKDNEQYQTEYNGQKQLKLQITKSKKDGSPSFNIDTFKPTPKVEDKPTPSTAKKEDFSDLPF